VSQSPKTFLLRMLTLIRELLTFESAFILFLFAGRYKNDPRFAWMPIDWTLFWFVISVFSGIWIIMSRGWKIRRVCFYLVVLASLFSGFVILSYFWTTDGVYARTKALYTGTLLLWSLVGPALVIAPDPERASRFLRLIIIFAIWIALEATQYYITSKEKIWFVRTEGTNYLGIGRICQIGLIVTTGKYLFDTRKIYRILEALLIGLFLWVLWISGGRGPLIYTVVGVIAVFASVFISAVRNGKRDISTFWRILAIGLSVSVFIILMIKWNPMSTTIQRLLPLLSGDLGISAGARLQWQIDTVSLIERNPIFGNGIGSWPMLMGFGDVKATPHNLLIEIISDIGFIGLALFLSVLVYAFYLLN